MWYISATNHSSTPGESVGSKGTVCFAAFSILCWVSWLMIFHCTFPLFSGNSFTWKEGFDITVSSASHRDSSHSFQCLSATNFNKRILQARLHKSQGHQNSESGEAKSAQTIIFTHHLSLHQPRKPGLGVSSPAFPTSSVFRVSCTGIYARDRPDSLLHMKSQGSWL